MNISCVPLCVRADEKLCVSLRSTRKRRGGFGKEFINITEVHLEESEKNRVQKHLLCSVFGNWSREHLL